MPSYFSFLHNLVYFLLLSSFFVVEPSPITIPLTPEGEINDIIPGYFGSKRGPKQYHKLSPNKSYAALELDSDFHETCGVELKLQWSTNTGSAIYSTPVIVPNSAGNNGMKQIFMSTYFNYVELLEGDGRRPAGWPITFEDSEFQSSPILHDIDSDGHPDIGIVDRNANLFWVRLGEFGVYLEDYHIQVPKLRIKKDWFDLVKHDATDSYLMLSMFDRISGPVQPPSPHSRSSNTSSHAKLDPLTSIIAKKASTKARKPAKAPEGRRKLLEEGDFEGIDFSALGHDDIADPLSDTLHINHGEASEPFDAETLRLMDEQQQLHEHGFPDGFNPDMLEDEMNAPPYAYGLGGMVRSADDGISYYMMRHYGNGGDEFDRNGKFLSVDPHILATPAMADINKDGHMEIVFPVSYYFDKNKYHDQQDIDPDMYIASGLVCWDMQAQEWSWTVHLDLSTSKSTFQGLIHASPTIADLDTDNRLEIIVGTSMGMLYILDGDTGFVRQSFPMQFHSILAQIAVADVVGSNHLELIVADMAGTLALVTVEGDILWDIQLSGSIPYTPTVADIDGDGHLDIIAVTVADNKKSHIWAIRGDNGHPLEGFPIALPNFAPISGPVIIVDLDPDSDVIDPVQKRSLYRLHNPEITVPFPAAKKGDPLSPIKEFIENQSKASRLLGNGIGNPHMVVTSLSGDLYIISMEREANQKTPQFCIQKQHLGGVSVASPLFDDVTSDGYLDLVVATLTGEVLVFETDVPHHPANTWTSFPKYHGRSFTHGDISISIPASERSRLKNLQYNGAKNLTIKFDIADRKCRQFPCEALEGRRYQVAVTRLGGSILQPLWKDSFDRPGQYTALVPIEELEKATLVVSLVTEQLGKSFLAGDVNVAVQYAEDYVPVVISTMFHHWIKYHIMTPVLIFCGLMLVRIYATGKV